MSHKWSNARVALDLLLAEKIPSAWKESAKLLINSFPSEGILQMGSLPSLNNLRMQGDTLVHAAV